MAKIRSYACFDIFIEIWIFLFFIDIMARLYFKINEELLSKMTDAQRKRAIMLFIVVSCLLGAANSLGEANYSNYFKEVYSVTAAQRGFIELPREAPGVLCMFIISMFGTARNVTIAIVAQLLSFAGMLVLGCFSPTYGVMLAFVFVHSVGQHIFITLKESIGMELAAEGEVGRTLGRFRRWWNCCAMLASITVFIGFRSGFFSFASKVIPNFVISAVFTLCAAILLFMMRPSMPRNDKKERHRLVLNRRYLPYYFITLAFGCQKRIRLVFAPWVVVELLHCGADTVALTAIATSFAAIMVAPALGRLLDFAGVKVSLLAEGIYMIATFGVFGVLVGGFDGGQIEARGIFLVFAFILVVLSCLIDQFNMVHSFLVRKLALNPLEVTATLSTGLSLDHVVAVAGSMILGVIWDGFGAKYVFFTAAACSVVQLIVALTLKTGERQEANG